MKLKEIIIYQLNTFYIYWVQFVIYSIFPRQQIRNDCASLVWRSKKRIKQYAKLHTTQYLKTFNIFNYVCNSLLFIWAGKLFCKWNRNDYSRKYIIKLHANRQNAWQVLILEHIGCDDDGSLIWKAIEIADSEYLSLINRQ